MKVLTPLKHGSTFAFTANISDINGNPQIGIANKLKSQLRSVSDVLIAELTISEESDGAYVFRADDTSNFPIGSTLYTDIRLLDGDITVYSETISVQIVRSETR